MSVYLRNDEVTNVKSAIRAMNANTIRLWAKLSIPESLLDRLWNGGVDPIYAILSFWIDPELDFSDDSPGRGSAPPSRATREEAWLFWRCS